MFDDSLISGSVTTQKELDDAFLKYPHYAKEYLAIALYREDTRAWYEKHWPTVRQFLDKDFVFRFKTNAEFEARAWEFHLAVVFIQKGLQLLEKTWETGPDFCVLLPNERKMWIEAIVCTLGEKDNDPVEPPPHMIPGVMYSFGGNIEDTQRPRALRITSAIASKYEKFNKYLQNSEESGVSDEDALVIAVNGRIIQHQTNANMLFKRAIFGQGPEVLVKRPGKEELESGYYKPVPTITKFEGDLKKEIPASFMEMDEFSNISAVLYCGDSAPHSWYNGYNLGDDFFFAYHVHPNNPIPDGTFKFGRGIRKNVSAGTITDIPQC